MRKRSDRKLMGISPSKPAPSGLGPEGHYPSEPPTKAVTGALRVAATAAARKPMESALASRSPPWTCAPLPTALKPAP
jgi:hypothetical protein